MIPTLVKGKGEWGWGGEAVWWVKEGVCSVSRSLLPVLFFSLLPFYSVSLPSLFHIFSLTLSLPSLSLSISPLPSLSPISFPLFTTRISVPFFSTLPYLNRQKLFPAKFVVAVRFNSANAQPWHVSYVGVTLMGFVMRAAIKHRWDFLLNF